MWTCRICRACMECNHLIVVSPTKGSMYHLDMPYKFQFLLHNRQLQDRWSRLALKGPSNCDHDSLDKFQGLLWSDPCRDSSTLRYNQCNQYRLWVQLSCCMYLLGMDTSLHAWFLSVWKWYVCQRPHYLTLQWILFRLSPCYRGNLGSSGLLGKTCTR